MSDIYKEVLDKIIFLYKGYSEVHRGSTQPFHLEKVRAHMKDYVYRHDDLLVREPLIEHSGSLPILATAIYPYINDSSVDLGRALIMLAIHDIGEVVTGDEIIFIKKKDSEEKEREQALKLLPPSLHEFYLEIEDLKTNTGRFAKSIDKMAPDILDLLTPAEATVLRFRNFVKKEPKEIIPTVKEFKHPYMLWNPFIKNLHLELLRRTDEKLQPFY